MKLNLFLSAIALLTTSLALADTETKDFDAKNLKELTVVNTTGKITISASSNAKATVTATKNKFAVSCKLTEDLSGPLLLVKIENADRSGDHCDVDLEIKIPKTSNVDLMSGTGNIKISGVQGMFTFKIGTSDLDADGAFQKIDGKSGTGKISIKGLVSGGEIKSGTGDVNLFYKTAPKSGSMDIKVGSGNASVSFPKGSKVKTDFMSATGHLNNDIGDSTDAAFTVSAKLGTGNLAIKTN